MAFRFETANERWKWYRLSVGMDQPDPGWNWQQEMSQSEPPPDGRAEVYFQEMAPYVTQMRQNAGWEDSGGFMGRSISWLNKAYQQYKSGSKIWATSLPNIKKDLQGVASGEFHPDAVDEALILIQYVDALIEISGEKEEPPFFGEVEY